MWEGVGIGVGGRGWGCNCTESEGKPRSGKGKEHKLSYLFCGMLDGLAFLPVEDVAEDMQYLRDNVPEDPPEAVELLDYFDKT